MSKIINKFNVTAALGVFAAIYMYTATNVSITTSIYMGVGLCAILVFGWLVFKPTKTIVIHKTKTSILPWVVVAILLMGMGAILFSKYVILIAGLVCLSVVAVYGYFRYLRK